MQKLGHSWVDVLKIDVEGSEFAVFERLGALGRGMPFTQMQVCAATREPSLQCKHSSSSSLPSGQAPRSPDDDLFVFFCANVV